MQTQIDVSRQSHIQPQEISAKVERIAAQFRNEWGVDYHWEGGDKLLFAARKGIARGVSGEILVSGSSVRVRMSLPLMLLSARRLITSAVERILAEELG